VAFTDSKTTAAGARITVGFRSGPRRQKKHLFNGRFGINLKNSLVIVDDTNPAMAEVAEREFLSSFDQGVSMKLRDDAFVNKVS